MINVPYNFITVDRYKLFGGWKPDFIQNASTIYPVGKSVKLMSEIFPSTQLTRPVKLSTVTLWICDYGALRNIIPQKLIHSKRISNLLYAEFKENIERFGGFLCPYRTLI